MLYRTCLWKNKQETQNPFYEKRRNPIIMSKNEKYFLNSLRYALLLSVVGAYNEGIYGSGLGSPLTQIFLPLRSRKTSYIPEVRRHIVFYLIYFFTN